MEPVIAPFAYSRISCFLEVFYDSIEAEHCNCRSEIEVVCHTWNSMGAAKRSNCNSFSMHIIKSLKRGVETTGNGLEDLEGARSLRSSSALIVLSGKSIHRMTHSHSSEFLSTIGHELYAYPQ